MNSSEIVNAIGDVFSAEYATLSNRTKSYEFLQTFVAANHDWIGAKSPDSEIMVGALRKELKNLSDQQFAFLLCHSGYIPEEYPHDKSEETIYTKLIEALVQEWAIRVGFMQSALPKQKSSTEDVTIQDDKVVLVCDAKSYRLGRSQKAPNVKDALKEGDVAKWISNHQIEGGRRTLGGLVTFPSQHDWSSGSDFYLYLTKHQLPIVCLFYEDLAYILLARISSQDLIGLFDNYSNLFPDQLTKAQKNRATYWSKVRGYLYDKSKVTYDGFTDAAFAVVREKALHTIRWVESHLTTLKQAHVSDIPENATAEELRAMLIEARVQLASLAIARQLGCITSFRQVADDYYRD